MDEPTPPRSTTGGPTVSRRRALVVAASGLSASLAGCMGLRGLSQSPAPDTLATRWTSDRTTEYGGNHHQFVALGSAGGSAIVAPHSSLTGNDDCGITAVNATGDAAWHAPIDPDHCTPHAVGDIGVGTRRRGIEVFGSTERGEVLGFDAVNGDRTLQVDALESIGYTAPVVGEFTAPNQVIAADFDGLMVAVDTDSKVAWRHNLDTRISVTPILGELTATGGPTLAVAHGRRDDSGVSLFGADGERRWTEAVDATPRSFTPHETASESVLAVGTREAAVCIEPRGETRWTVPFDEIVSVGGGDDNRLFVAANDGLVRAVDVTDGDLDWERVLLDGDETRLNPPVVGDPYGDGTATVAVTTYTGAVVLLDTAGAVLGRYESEAAIYVSPQFADLTGDGSDDLLIMDGFGRLTAIEFRPES